MNSARLSVPWVMLAVFAVTLLLGLYFTFAMSGFGRVYLNGNEVSKKRGFGGESHDFNYKDSSYQLNVWPLISFHTLGLSILMISVLSKCSIYDVKNLISLIFRGLQTLHTKIGRAHV